MCTVVHTIDIQTIFQFQCEIHSFDDFQFGEHPKGLKDSTSGMSKYETYCVGLPSQVKAQVSKFGRV